MVPLKSTGRDRRSSPWTRHVSLLMAMLASTLPVLANAPPSISDIASQTTNEDTAKAVAFTVSDPESAAEVLTVTAVSSDSTLIPSAVVSGSGGSRQVTLTPAANANGTAEITLTVSDGTNSVAKSFQLTVTAVNDPPTFTPGSNVTVPEDSGATNTVGWATAISAGPSDESAQTLSFVVVTNTDPRLFSSGPSINSGGDLSFTPAANAFGSATLTIQLVDNGGTSNGGIDRSTETTFQIDVTAVNDPPTFDGTILGTPSTPILDSGVGITLFQNLSVTDADGESENVTVRVTPGATAANYGNFRDSELPTFSGTTGTVTTNLRSALFDAIPNSVPSGQTNQFTLVIELSDSGSTNRTTNTVHIAFSNDPPTVTSTVAPSTVPDNQVSYPFQIQMDDPDSTSGLFTLRMEILDGATWGSLVPASPAANNTLPAIQSFVRGVGFQPLPNRIPSNQVVQIRFSVTDSGGATGIVTNQLTIQAVNDAPQLAGISLDILRTTDDPARPLLLPFSNVSVADADESGQQALTVTLSVDDPAKGTLSRTNIEGPAASVSSAIRAVSFRAAQRTNRVVGETVTASVTVRVRDAGNAQVVNDRTLIAITSVNGSPVFKGIPLDQPAFVAPEDPKPFRGITVEDDDNTNVVVTIRFDADKGSLTNLGGFTNPSPGVYTQTNLPALLTSALTNLGFRVNPNHLFPANEPGGTTFTLEAIDSIRNATATNLSIVLQAEPRNHLVTRTADDEALGSLRHAIQIAGNNDVITFALGSYPALIRLTNALQLTRNVTLLGPGADLLTLSGDSDGDGAPNTRLFTVEAAVNLLGLTLTRGGASVDGAAAVSGGAIYVGSRGRLVIRSCAITDSTAPQWGGGIDVDQGDLTVENCLFRGNRTTGGAGLGGGAVSLYTDLPCSFVSSTFSGNQQASGSGIGGGALYVENVTPSSDLNVLVSQCTFAENEDLAEAATSILGNAFGTMLQVRSCIFADARTRNLDVVGSARIVSEGGNLSDDPTTTILTQGGQPQAIVLLDHFTDRTSTDALLGPLDSSVRPTPAYPLLAGSPAIGRANIPYSGVDQRGVFRDGDPDSGALEYETRQRLVINEVHFNPAAGETQFVEMFVPRDAVPVDLDGFRLRVNGVERYQFPGSYFIQPGRGVLFASALMTAGSTSQPTPVITNLVGGGLNLGGRGTIELLRSDLTPLVHVSYVGRYVDPSTPANQTAFTNQAITLAPQFRGFALVPHKLVSMSPPPFGSARLENVSTGRSLSPGQDAGGTAFGATNALPVAVPDSWVVGEDEVTALPVLANDFDADGSDRLVILNLSTNSSPAGSTNTVTSITSVEGAAIAVTPEATELIYDPRLSTFSNGLQSLALGARRSETFYYSIVDYGVGSILDFQGTNTLSPTTIVSPAHRLNSGEEIVISGSGQSGYNTNAVITRIDDDRFSVGISFVGSPALKGSWITSRPRLDTARSETNVTVTVLGANDPPLAVDDTVQTDEETILRILADPTLLGTPNLAFPSDPVYPAPRAISPLSLLGPGNDDDLDTDDSPLSLHLVGVVGRVHPITSFAGNPGLSPVSVTSTNHGLTTGTRILISGYAGHPSYNGYHTATVTDAHTFSIPIPFVDGTPGPRALWCIIEDATRLEAVSEMGAVVRLEIRADRARTCLVYNPRSSDELNFTAAGETRSDAFYYAVEDRHGAISLGKVTVRVTGVNDAPVTADDPSGLARLDPLLNGTSGSLADLLATLDVLYSTPASSGLTGRADAQVRAGNQAGAPTLPLENLWSTPEDVPLSIPAADLTANDVDVDTSDTLTVGRASPLSWEGAIISLVTNDNKVSVSYDPTGSTNLNRLAREELRIDSFEITVTDSNGGLVTNEVAVLVVGVNDPPVAVDDAVVTTEDLSLNFNPLNTPPGDPSRHDADVDIDGRAPDNRLVSLPVTNALTGAGATVSITGNTLAYDPRLSAFLNALGPTQSFTDSYDYTVTDGSLVFANNDLFKVAADGADYVLDLLANDRNLAGAGGSLRIVELGASDRGGLVTLLAGAQVVYTPPINLVDDEFFTYTVADESGNKDSGLVRVRATQTLLNGNLDANDDHFSVARGESPLLDVLANDHVLPEGGANLTITRIVAAPNANGQAVVENNLIRFTPNPAAPPNAYLETFTYEISGGGTARAEASVEVWVIDRRNTLFVGDDAFSVQEGSPNNVLNVLLNDNILPGSPLGLSIQSIVTNVPLQGRLSINADRTALIYNARAGFVGEETVYYRVTDSLGATGQAQATIRVGSIAAIPDYFAVPADTNVPPVSLTVLANDRAPGGTSAENFTVTGLVALSANAPNNMVQIDPTRKRLTYFPTNSVEGEFVYRYTTSDGFGRNSSANITVLVMRNGLKANSDHFTVAAPSAGNVLEVLRNDAAIPDQGRPLKVVSVGVGVGAPNRGGTVSVDGSSDDLIYTPASGFVGEETFTYTMTDSTRTDTARVVVRVASGDLIANDDIFTVFFEPITTGGPARSFSLPVLANDRVLDTTSPTLTISSAAIDAFQPPNAPPQAGTVTVSDDRTTLLYTPRDASGPFPYVERLAYEVSDGTTRRAAGVVEVTVLRRAGAHDLDTSNDAFSVVADSVSNVLPVMFNDGVKPATADGWTITTVTTPAFGGVAQISGRTSIVYTPRPGFVGTDRFTYAVSDGLGGTGSADVRVKVGDLPLTDDAFTALSGSVDNEFEVLANDGILPATASRFRLVAAGGATRNGGVKVVDGRLFYTPDPNYGGRYPYVESFLYQVEDDSGLTAGGRVEVTVYKSGSDRDTATVRFTVQGVNDAPTIAGTGAAGTITDKQTIAPFPSVTIGEVDDQGAQIVTVSVSLNSAQGVLTQLGGFTESGAGRYDFVGTATNATVALRGLVYDPVENRIPVPSSEITTFTVSVTDGIISEPVRDSLTVLTVSAVNDPPVVSGTVSGQTVHRLGTVKPFSGVTISDVDDLTLQPLVVTVALDSASKGFLSSLGPFLNLGGGVYRLGSPGAGVTPAVASAALRGLVFHPTTAARVISGSPETTQFTISVNDGFAPPAVDTTTSVIALHEFMTSLTATDGNAADLFGSAVAASLDVVVVGAPQSDPRGNSSGAAYVFVHPPGLSTQWAFVQKLVPSDGATGEEFGNAVAISGNTIAVAARFAGRSPNSGAVYLYERASGGGSNWNQVKRLAPSDGAGGDEFGSAVSLDQNLLVVGSRADDDAGRSSGTAYVYGRNRGGIGNWGLVKKLTASDAAAGDEFGISVGIHANTIVVGAHLDVQSGIGSGSAYVFEKDTGGSDNWGQRRKLVPSEGLTGDAFGFAVSIHGDTVVVGSPHHDHLGNDRGSVYLFQRDQGGSGNWGGAGEVLSPTSLNNDQFGYSVSLDRNLWIAGLPFFGIDNQSKFGTAFAYSRPPGTAAAWGLLQQLDRPNPGNNDQFGLAVDIGQGTVIVGASYDDDRGNDSGSVHIYRLKYNNPPSLVTPIPDQFGSTGVRFEFVVPPGTFADADLGDTLRLSAGSVDGSALPAWLVFASETATLSGTPPLPGTYLIRLTATDEDGATATASFGITVDGDTSVVSSLNDPVAGQALRPRMVDDPITGHLIITYTRTAAGSHPAYVVESSDDLVHWVPATADVISETVTSSGAGRQQVTLEVRKSTSSPQGRFFRIRQIDQ